MPGSTGSVSLYAINPADNELPAGVYGLVEGGGYGDPVPRSLWGEVSGFTIQNNAIFNPLNPTESFALFPGGDNYLQVSPDGSVQIQAGGTFDQINRGTSLNQEYGMSGTFAVPDEFGNLTEVPLQWASLGQTGKRWALYRTDSGLLKRQQVDANLTFTDLVNQSTAWQRFLSPAEVQAEALRGRLFQMSRGKTPEDRMLYRGILQSMGLDPDSEDINDYNLITAWVESSEFRFQSARRITFAPGSTTSG